MDRHRGSHSGSRKLISAFTALCLLAFSGTGCVSTRVVREASMDSDTSVSLSVYLEEKDRRRGRPTVDGVVTELYYLDGDQRQLLCRKVSGDWRMAGLVPGQYEAEVRYRAGDDGEWEELRGDTRESFTLHEGENADIGIVLEKTPVVVIVVASLAAVVLAVLLVDTLDDADIGLDELLIPPVPEAVAVLAPPPEMVWIAAEMLTAPSENYIVPGAADAGYRPGQGSGLIVVDHHPRHLSTAIDPEADLRFKLNRALDPASLDPGDVLLVDGSGQQVTGGVYYLDDSRTCVFDPLRPLEPGQTYTVTLRGEGLLTPDGSRLAEDYWWYFTTVFPEGSAPAS
jgi:hypothetical protein